MAATTATVMATAKTKTGEDDDGMPLFLFRVIVSLIKERDLATRILVQKLNVVNHLIPTQ